MRKVPEREFKQYVSWAEMNTANTVYPLSIAEGFQPGEIYADEARTGAVFFRHYCGFGYISGDPSDEFLDDIYEELISCPGGRRLILITHDEGVIRYFRDKDVRTESRIEYVYRADVRKEPGIDCVYRPEGRKEISLDTDRFRIEPIDGNNISGIEGKIIPSFSWDSAGRFLGNGFGYVAVENGSGNGSPENGKICAAAFSAAVSSREVDIGVETREEYRRNGLAQALSAKMCEHIVSTGKKPVWAHSASNTGSMNTALGCGFAEVKRNTVIKHRTAAVIPPVL